MVSSIAGYHGENGNGEMNNNQWKKNESISMKRGVCNGWKYGVMA